MPVINGLTLNVSGNSSSSAWTSANVTLNVAYTATFSTIERFLAANGLVFEERIQIVGDDPGEATDKVMYTFPAEGLQIAAGTGNLTVSRNRSITVSDGVLDEDPDVVRYPSQPGGWPRLVWNPDADELFARVEVAYVGLNPHQVRADSPVRTLSTP
jgi:hypothetical protein